MLIWVVRVGWWYRFQLQVAVCLLQVCEFRFGFDLVNFDLYLLGFGSLLIWWVVVVCL